MGAHRLSRVLDEQVDLFAHALRRARRGEPKGVHRARVASRRIREVLPLLDADPESKDSSRWQRLRRDIRRVAVALGAVRELDVSRVLLEDAAGRHAWRPAMVARVRPGLKADRHGRHAELVDTVKRVGSRALIRDLRHASASAPADRASVRKALDERRRKRAEALAASLWDLGTLYVPDRLHAVRLAAKKLRYILETDGAVTRTAVARDVRTLTTMQEYLGELHDLQVLQARLRGDARGLNAAEVRRMSADVERECRAMHAHVVARARTWLKLAKRIAGR